MIIVDLQNDFLPGGSLPVSGGNTIIPTLNRYIADFHAHRLPIVASRDWHPENHCSFEAFGGRWPAHCIAKTNGAAFPAALELPAYTKIISKATTQARDAYSAFSETQLNELLRSLNVKRLFIGGLATEYCVLNTVEDAIRFHYVTFILEDAACAINHQPDDGRDALLAMKRLGAIPIDRKMLEP